MKMWKNIRIPGSIWSTLLVGVMLGITTVLFIELPISQTNDNTLGESIFGKRENQKGVNVESHPKVTGSGITGHVQNSKTTSNSLGKILSDEKSSHYTGHLEGSTTKRPDSFFFTTF